MKSPTLLVMAAGMGSRYGGLKQIDPVGPHGELIIDYSVYDALRAGFGKVVFVIRHFFEQEFMEKMGRKFGEAVETVCAFQELEAGLDGFPLPANREKPWGTGHAILMAKDLIDEPFAVINADDYYGQHSFQAIADYLRSTPGTSAEGVEEYSMVGYVLRNTLSEHGTVARGVCESCEGGYLQHITERTKIRREGRAAAYIDEAGTEHALTGDETVSMNLWGFQPTIFGHLATQFAQFLREHADNPKSELYIPSVVDRLIGDGTARVRVLPTHDTWFGVTYREDKEKAAASIRKLVDEGVYPERLWNGR